MKPACVKCQRFFRPKKTGFAFIEAMPRSNMGEPTRAQPGTAEPHRWTPYKLWIGDLWECEGCGAEAIFGVGQGPVAEHYQPDFSDKVARYGAFAQINDC